MRFRVVADYRRREHFEFYRRFRHPFYSATFELEFSRWKAFADEHGYSTYVNLCYAFTRAMQPLADFRYRWRGGEIVLYETVHPGLTYPAAGGLFSFVYLDYDADVHRFNERARSRLPAVDEPPRLEESEHGNYVFYTALPGVPFSAFSHATDDPLDGAPRVAFGRFRPDGEKIWVPVGIEVNHAFIDGRALGELYERAATELRRPR